MMRFLIGLFLSIMIAMITGERAHAEEAAISFFYYNTCASCKEEDKIYEILKDHGIEAPCYLYNTFQSENNIRYEETLKELGITREEGRLPLLVTGGRYVSGYEEINSKISELLEDAVWESSIPNDSRQHSPEKRDSEELILEKSDVKLIQQAFQGSELLLFTTDSCKDCESVKSMTGKLSSSSGLPAIQELNILEEENLNLLQQCFLEYDIPAKDQQVPILIAEDGYVAGASSILSYIRGDRGELILKDRKTESGEREGFFQMFLTGFINGWNPCALSMLFFLLSLLIQMEGNVLKNGLWYVAGKWIAYVAMGTGFLAVFGAAGTYFTKGFEVLRYIMVIAVVILSVWNLLDAIQAVRGEYGKIKVQLPLKLRNFNHKLIKSIMKQKRKRLGVIIFLLSVFISGGEFFCTGQIYAATLFLLARQNGITALPIIKIICYVTALCVPSFIILAAVQRSREVLTSSGFLLRFMPVIKILNSIMFLVFALLYLYL